MPKVPDEERLKKCRDQIIAVARKRELVPYARLAGQIGVSKQELGSYLTAISQAEIRRGHPDLTLVAVYSHTGIGRFNSHGKGLFVRADPRNPKDVARYKDELARVYAHWGMQEEFSEPTERSLHR